MLVGVFVNERAQLKEAQMWVRVGQFVKTISQTGMIFGLITLGNKASSGLGKVIAGGLLEASNFPAKEKIASLTPEILANLGLLLAAVVFVAGGAAFLILRTYNLSRERHKEIVDALALRAEATLART